MSDDMPKAEAEYFVKVKGQEYAFGVMNLKREHPSPGFISFDRLNTKTGQITGSMEVSNSEVVSIEKRVPQAEVEEYT